MAAITDALRLPADPLDRRRIALLVALMAFGLVLSFWAEGRALWVDLAGLILLATLVWTTRRAGWRWSQIAAPLTGPVLAFVFVFGLAMDFSILPNLSLQQGTGVLAYLLIFQLVGNLLRWGWSPAVLYRALVYTALIVLGILVVTWLQDGLPLVGYRFRYETNNSMALYNLLLFPALATGEVWPLVVIPALYVAWFSASRGGTAGLAVGVITLSRLVGGSFAHLATWIRRHALVVAISAAAFGVIVVWQLYTIQHGGRAELWGIAWQMFTNGPLLGQGPGTYKFFFLTQYPDWPHYGHAHNVVLNLLAETGALGLTAAAWMGARVVRQLWPEALSGNRWAAGALAALAALAVQSLGDVPTTQGYVTVTALVLIQLGLHKEKTANGIS